MKAIIQDSGKYLLRFDKGEEVLTTLGNFLKEQNITACTFSGIGACSEVELAFFNTFTKQYRHKPYVEELEVVSFSGNGALNNGEPTMHAHGSFGRNDFTTLSGHVFKLVISVTCEIFLIKLEGELKREVDSNTNLNLLA